MINTIWLVQHSWIIHIHLICINTNETPCTSNCIYKWNLQSHCWEPNHHQGHWSPIAASYCQVAWKILYDWDNYIATEQNINKLLQTNIRIQPILHFKYLWVTSCCFLACLNNCLVTTGLPCLVFSDGWMATFKALASSSLSVSEMLIKDFLAKSIGVLLRLFIPSLVLNISWCPSSEVSNISACFEIWISNTVLDIRRRKTEKPNNIFLCRNCYKLHMVNSIKKYKES